MAEDAGEGPDPERGRTGAPRAHCVGVVLVHGIGQTQPGEVVEATARALGARGDGAIAFDDHTEVHELAEPRVALGDGGWSRFPCHVKRARLSDGRPVVFGEVYWSDVKSADARKMSPLLLFLSTVLSAHRVINALLARRDDAFAQALRPLLLAGAYLLRGPIIGLNLVLLVMLFAIKYCRIATDTLGVDMGGFYFVLGGLVFSALAGAIIVSGRIVSAARFGEIGWSAVLISALGVGLTLAALEGGPISAFSEFAFFSKGWAALVVLWSVLTGVVLIAATLLAAALLTCPRPNGVEVNRAAVFAVAILMSQSLIWATVMRIVWLSFAEDLETTIDLGQVTGVVGREAVQTLQITVLVNIIILALIFASIGAVGLVRRVLARALPRRFSPRALPRLMFSPFALNVAIIAGVLGYLTAAASVFSRTALGDALGSVTPDMLSEAVDMALPMIERRPLEFIVSSLVVLSPTLLFFFNRSLTSGSHLLQDIIDYHPDVATTLARRGGGRLQPRARISDRFAQVIEHLEREEQARTLVIMAHSQGSVIAHDFLRSPSAAAATGAAMTAPVDVITFGSPLRHIYAHYFKDYAGFLDGLDRVGAGVRSWRNLFRADDVIGTRLSGDADCFIKEQALPPGGHADYWSERAVGDAVLDSLGVGPSRTAALADSLTRSA